MRIDPRELLRSARTETAAPAPLSGSRAERIQRLQVGLFGLGAMVLIVALADIVISRARQTEETVVAEAAPTVAPSATPTQRDPLADAGVVPSLTVEGDDAATGPDAPQEEGDAPPPVAPAANAPGN